MINSIDAEKSFGKIQHTFIMKTLNELNIKENYVNIIKAIHEKSTANIILNGERLKSFPLRSGKRQGCLLLLQIGREKIILSLFADDILFVEKKNSTKKLLGLIREFSNLAGYKSTHKN